MTLEFKQRLIENIGSLIFMLKKIYKVKQNEVEIKDNQRYQLQRIADELNSIKYILEEMNQK